MRRLLAVAFAATACSLWLLVPPASAAADGIGLASSSPSPSTRVDSAPDTIVLTFDSPVADGRFSVELLDARRETVPTGRVWRASTNTSVVIVEDVPDLADGTWVVRWSATGEDGRTVEGAFPFEVGDEISGTTDRQLEQILEGLTTDSDLGFILGVGRFLALAGTIVLAGAVLLVVATPLASSSRTTNILMSAVLASTAGSVLVLLLEGAYSAGKSWGSVLDPGLVSDAIGSRVGAAALARAFLSVGWLGLVVSAPRASGSTAWRRGGLALSVTSTVALVAGWGTGVHARSVVEGVVDAVLLGALAAWFGGLAGLRALAGASDDDVRIVASRWSHVVAVASPVALVASAAAAFVLEGGVEAATGSDRGRAILVATALLVPAALLSLLARARVRTVGSSASRGVLALAMVASIPVLAAVALAAGSSPRFDEANRSSYGVALVESDVVADVAVTPAAVGTTEIHVFFSPPGGMLAPVESAEMTLSAPGIGIPAMPVTLVEAGPNHWSGVVQLPYAAEWTMDFSAVPAGAAAVAYTTSFTVTGD